MKKTTKAQKNMDIIAMLRGEKVTYGTTVAEAIEHLEHENEMLAKKNNKNKKPTEKQKENEHYKELILEYLSEQEEPKTVTEITKAIPEISSFTNQKVSAIVKQMKDEKQVEKTVVKGRAVFALPKEE